MVKQPRTGVSWVVHGRRGWQRGGGGLDAACSPAWPKGNVIIPGRCAARMQCNQHGMHAGCPRHAGRSSMPLVAAHRQSRLSGAPVPRTALTWRSARCTPPRVPPSPACPMRPTPRVPAPLSPRAALNLMKFTLRDPARGIPLLLASNLVGYAPMLLHDTHPVEEQSFGLTPPPTFPQVRWTPA